MTKREREALDWAAKTLQSKLKEYCSITRDENTMRHWLRPIEWWEEKINHLHIAIDYLIGEIIKDDEATTNKST